MHGTFRSRGTASQLLMLLAHAPFGQTPSGEIGRRVQGGGLNYAPLPKDFAVVAVDWRRRMVTLRDADETRPTEAFEWHAAGDRSAAGLHVVVCAQ